MARLFNFGRIFEKIKINIGLGQHRIFSLNVTKRFRVWIALFIPCHVYWNARRHFRVPSLTVRVLQWLPIMWIIFILLYVLWRDRFRVSKNKSAYEGTCVHSRSRSSWRDETVLCNDRFLSARHYESACRISTYIYMYTYTHMQHWCMCMYWVVRRLLFDVYKFTVRLTTRVPSSSPSIVCEGEKQEKSKNAREPAESARTGVCWLILLLFDINNKLYIGMYTRCTAKSYTRRYLLRWQR